MATIWEFFTISERDESKASCKYCSKLISRGGSNRNNFGHSGLKKHLATHPKQYEQYLSRAKHVALEKANEEKEKQPKVHKTKISLMKTLKLVYDTNKKYSDY